VFPRCDKVLAPSCGLFRLSLGISNPILFDCVDLMALLLQIFIGHLKRIKSFGVTLELHVPFVRVDYMRASSFSESHVILCFFFKSDKPNMFATEVLSYHTVPNPGTSATCLVVLVPAFVASSIHCLMELYTPCTAFSGSVEPL
jgi:hypothetical protein